MTRALPEPAAGQRRVRSATIVAAAAATVAAALFGVLFAEPGRPPAVAAPQAAPSPLSGPSPGAEHAPATPDTVTPDPATPEPVPGAAPTPSARHHRVRRPAPVQPPPQPPARSSGRGTASSGAS